MSHSRRPHRFVPGFDRIEQRAMPAPAFSSFSLGGLSSILDRLGNVPDLDAAGLALLKREIRAGAGAEFVKLLNKTPGGTQAILEFATGRRDSLRIPGLIVVDPKSRTGYAGVISDQINPNAAGAVVVNRRTLSLAAMMRGPIDAARFGRYVWALDTGRGATTVWSERPGIKADTLIAVERAADGSVRVQVEDLKSGSIRTLNPGRVKVMGATIRLRINPITELPTGASMAKARFAFWVQDEPAGASVDRVTRFLPDTSLRVGKLTA